MLHRSPLLARAVAAVALLLALPVSVLAKDGTPPPATFADPMGLPELRVRITDTAYEGLPAETPAGRYLVTLEIEAAEGGELGWIARFQLDPKSEEAIFATPVGRVTDPIAVDGEGVHLYKILDEATRKPDDEQRDRIEETAFENWYEAKKAEFDIKRDPSILATS